MKYCSGLGHTDSDHTGLLVCLPLIVTLETNVDPSIKTQVICSCEKGLSLSDNPSGFSNLMNHAIALDLFPGSAPSFGPGVLAGYGGLN